MTATLSATRRAMRTSSPSTQTRLLRSATSATSTAAATAVPRPDESRSTATESVPPERRSSPSLTSGVSAPVPPPSVGRSTSLPTPTLSPSTTGAATATATAPVVAVVLPVRVVPTSAAVATGSQQAARAVALTTAVAGAPGVAMQAGRVESLRALLACASNAAAEEGDDTTTAPEQTAELPWSVHPTRFRLEWAGDHRAALDAAAVVGNALVLGVAFPLVTLAVVAPLRWQWRRRSKGDAAAFAAAVAWCRFPGTFAVALPLLLPALAERAVAVASGPTTGGITPAGRAVGTVGIVLTCCVLTAAVAMFHRYFHAAFRWHADDDCGSALDAPAPPSAAPDRLSRARQLLEGTGRAAWVAVAVAATDTSRLVRAFGMFFDAYGPRAPWFFVADLATACAVSMLAGALSGLGCRGLAWAMTSVSMLYAGTVTALRPHANRVDGAIYIAVAWVQTAAVLSAAVAQEVPASAATANASQASAAAASLTVAALGAYELAKAAYLQWLRHTDGRRRHQDLHDAAQLLLPDSTRDATGDAGGAALDELHDEALIAAAAALCGADDADHAFVDVSDQLDGLLPFCTAAPAPPIAVARNDFARPSSVASLVIEGTATAAERSAELLRLRVQEDLAGLLGYEADAAAARTRAARVADAKQPTQQPLPDEVLPVDLADLL